METKFVYIIQDGFENLCATLDKEVAKQFIKNEILENAEDEVDEQKVEKFAQDLVDGNTEGHYSDEFASANVYIWCDRLVLRE